MIKAIALTLAYAVVVSLGMNHFFGSELLSESLSIGGHSGREMAQILACVPGVWFFMDYLDKKDNSPE